MNGFLLDTNCVSELVKSSPEPKVLGWLKTVDEDLLFLSVLTIGEIKKGISNLPAGKRKHELDKWLESQLKPRFSGRLLGIDSAVAERWAIISSARKSKGRPIQIIDGLIAATAQQHNLILTTRNVTDFDGIELSVLNPWL